MLRLRSILHFYSNLIGIGFSLLHAVVRGKTALLCYGMYPENCDIPREVLLRLKDLLGDTCMLTVCSKDSLGMKKLKIIKLSHIGRSCSTGLVVQVLNEYDLPQMWVRIVPNMYLRN